CEKGIDLVLMDKVADNLAYIQKRTQYVMKKLGRKAKLKTTTDLDVALADADFAVAAIEVNRYLYWSQDFHVPRKYGFRQIYGENGGVGGIFHALRNMGPMVHIAKTIEKLCPNAILLNYTNPEHKLCEAISRLTSVEVYGLCHGVFMGKWQISQILNIPMEQLETTACGINHFTWFQKIRDRRTGEDLYPRLRKIEGKADWLTQWHELALGRVLFRRFGLWPSPATNHYGEYIRWAEEFMADELQYFYDPMEGHPWQTGKIPEFVYTADGVNTSRPWIAPTEQEKISGEEEAPITPSGELAVPIMEGVACGLRKELAAVNAPNKGKIPNLPDDMVVELPAIADSGKVQTCQMEPLPEAIAAMLHLQGSIHKLIVEAYAEKSKDKLLQAILLDPTVHSYRGAVDMMGEMLSLQEDLLPELK
ncbi:MAG: alpha-galactosidase, partial [Candidatus Bathyarchaeia archaeon]